MKMLISPLISRGLITALLIYFSTNPSLFAQAPNAYPRPSANSQAYARAGDVRIAVAPDRASWTYSVGEQVTFHIKVTADHHALAGGVIRYRLGPEMLPAEEQTAILPANGGPLLIDGGTLSEPGFIRCVVTMDIDGRSYRAVGTAGFSPNEILPTQTEPEDFDAFWAAAKAELAETPMDVLRTRLPYRCTPTVDVYQVGIRMAGAHGSRIYGILCVPKGEGPFPAILQVPGAGVRSYGGAIALAERGVITLQIGIHGIPVTLDNEVYTQLGNGALHALLYPLINLDDRNQYYYRRVYLGCLRANDYLVSLPEFDRKTLLVMGGSQGGQLSIVTAALDSRVTALSAFYPAYCDVTGYLQGRAGGWPHMMRAGDDGAPSAHATLPKLHTTSYYDVVNFARRLKVAGHYAWGYNDEICPPTSMYAAYNVISAPKKLLLALEVGHDPILQEDAIATAWVVERLGLGTQ